MSSSSSFIARRPLEDRIDSGIAEDALAASRLELASMVSASQASDFAAKHLAVVCADMANAEQVLSHAFHEASRNANLANVVSSQANEQAARHRLIVAVLKSFVLLQDADLALKYAERHRDFDSVEKNLLARNECAADLGTHIDEIASTCANNLLECSYYFEEGEKIMSLLCDLIIYKRVGAFAARTLSNIFMYKPAAIDSNARPPSESLVLALDSLDADGKCEVARMIHNIAYAGGVLEDMHSVALSLVKMVSPSDARCCIEAVAALSRLVARSNPSETFICDAVMRKAGALGAIVKMLYSEETEDDDSQTLVIFIEQLALQSSRPAPATEVLTMWQPSTPPTSTDDTVAISLQHVRDQGMKRLRESLHNEWVEQQHIETLESAALHAKEAELVFCTLGEKMAESGQVKIHFPSSDKTISACRELLCANSSYYNSMFGMCKEGCSGTIVVDCDFSAETYSAMFAQLHSFGKLELPTDVDELIDTLKLANKIKGNDDVVAQVATRCESVLTFSMDARVCAMALGNLSHLDDYTQLGVAAIAFAAENIGEISNMPFWAEFVERFPDHALVDLARSKRRKIEC